MSNIFWKNFYLCFSKIKCPQEALNPPPSPTNKNHDRPSPPFHPITSTLINNFNSFYDLTSDSTTDSFFSSAGDSDTDSTPDFATLFASQRFFFSSPGRSNSIFESPDSPPESNTLLTGGVAIQTYSPDPYTDFRLSMQEMIEARELIDVKANWDYLYELLSSYLTLNPKHTHKFIISAFTDILISLLSSTANESGRKPEECGPHAFIRR